MRRLIVALLTFAILLGMTLSSVFATDLQNNSTEKEELYYTDLFYAYPYYLERDTYFQEYTAVVGGLYDTVHTAYQNSPLLMETGMEYALRNITSPTEITKLITDTLGLTDFSYNDALDAANNAVVVELLSETSAGTLEKSYGKTCKWVGNIQKLTSYFNKLEQESETGQIQYTAEYYTQVAFDYLWDNGYLSMISDTTLSQLWLEINNSDFQLDDYFTLAKTEVEIAEALVIALMMEDIRLEIINDILVTQSNDTVLKQGMTRLKNKLQKNVVSYFISEYIVNKLADDLFGEIDSFVLDAIGGTQIASLFKIAHKVFTVVYDAPSVENVLMWQVLFCYSQDLSGAISEASQSFDDGPLFSDKILSYENLFAGYDAINKATVKTTKEIAEKLDPYIKVYSILDGAVTNGDEIVLIQIGNSETTVPATTSRQEMFNILLEKTKEVFENDLISDLKEPVIKVSNSTSTVKLQIHQDVFAIAMRDAVGSVRETIDFYDSRYKEVNIFEEHINSVKETIISTPLAERITIEKSTYSNWTYNVTSKISIKQQSDIVENSCIYAVNGHIQGNITFTCDFSIPKEQIHYIDGNVKVAAYKTLTIPQGEQITIDGNVKVSYDGATLCNEGTLTITGDLEIDRAGVVRNKGNLTVCETFIHSLYDGEFYNEAVFQTKNVKAPKLVFSATEDALFCVSGDVSGSVDLNGAPQCAIPGTVVFNGSDQQCVRGLIVHDVVVTNPKGLKYLSNFDVYGYYQLNSNPLDTNGYKTRAYNGASFDNSDFGSMTLTDVTLQGNLHADVLIYETLLIPQGEQITIDGNVKVSYDGATLCNEGTLTITGDLEIDRAGVVRNKGNLTVCETFIHSLYDGEFYNEAVFQTKNVKAPKLVFSATEDALFCVSGDVSGSVDLNGAPQCAIPGTVVFNGSDQQCVRGLSAEVLTIDNCSVGGVVFESAVSVNTLFNHRGNKFVLKKGGSFVDYDGDGLKDNVDPHPTIAESCLDGHSFGDWLITVEPTPSTSGEREKACSRCNTVLTEELPQICQLSFKGASLSLQHNLAINYKVDKALFEDVGYTDPYVVFELNGVKTKVHSYTIAGDRYIFTFRNIAPNQMNDTIYATLYATYNGVEYASATREYSVAEYCYSMLELYSAAEYAELRTLLVDLLHYGAASQTYTGYRTDALVNASLTAAQLQWGTSEEPALDTALDTAYKTVENPTAKWKGAGLHLQESVAMRLRFTAESIDGLSVKIESGESTWTISSDKFLEEDGVYYVYFTGLDAGQMRQSVYLTIYDGDTPVSNTVCYSIGSYAYEKQNSTIAGLPELVKAMMKYGDSAYAYVH